MSEGHGTTIDKMGSVIWMIWASGSLIAFFVEDNDPLWLIASALFFILSYVIDIFVLLREHSRNE